MDLLKNFIYAGVGLAATTSDRLKETIEDLVEKGKISDTEGRKIVDDFFKSTEGKKDDFEAKLKKVQEDLSGKFDFKKKNNDDEAIEALNKRIADLEAKLEKAEAVKVKSATAQATDKTPLKTKATKSPAAKKTTAKKVTTKKPDGKAATTKVKKTTTTK
jgi:polyhydroxyalkanoate synthesis regulator phasin